jgi:nucleoside-diphosphate-sugar epimerase
VVELLNLSVLNDLTGSNVFNLSSDDTLKINELVSIMKNIVQEDFKIDYKENRHSDNSAIMLDNSRIKAALPDYQFTGIYEGIAETYANIKAQLHQKN